MRAENWEKFLEEALGSPRRDPTVRPVLAGPAPRHLRALALSPGALFHLLNGHPLTTTVDPPLPPSTHLREVSFRGLGPARRLILYVEHPSFPPTQSLLAVPEEQVIFVKGTLVIERTSIFDSILGT